MKACGPSFRAVAVLGMFVLAAAAAGCSTTGYAMGPVSKFSRMVGTSAADAAEILSSEERLAVQATSPEIREAREERVRERLSSVRIPFIANSGQTDSAVAYYAPTFAGTVFVTRDGQIVYSLPGEKVSASRDRHIVDSAPKGRASSSRSPGRKGGWTLTETVVGGRARPSGSDNAFTRVSYFLGNDPARWKSELPTFEGVSLGEVWPGISLDLQARGKNVEKRFTVEPGADPSRIRMRLTGAQRLRVNDAGGLVVATGPGEVTFTPPAAFQERDGVRHSVKATYALHGREYGFRLGDYDPALPLLIDPLLQATYLGGIADDFAYALAIHPTTGDVYVAGETRSMNFPGTAGGAQAANGDPRCTVAACSDDVFVAHLNSALTTLDQATYLGGASDDLALALAIHPMTGDVYVAGDTSSTNFPGTAGGAQATSGVSPDAFVARLNSALTTLKQATYLGGGGFDLAWALAIHPTTGDVYVAGETRSTNFPGTAGGAQAANIGGHVDAFVAHLNSALTTLDQATYLGGSLDDFAQALAIHPTTGDVYVAGRASSTDFPGTAGGAQAAHAADSLEDDAFIAHLNSALTTLVQATYLGGNGVDIAQALAIHPMTGDVYVAGYTASTNFPGTVGGAQTANAGIVNDAFVARLNSALTTLDQATYLGGTGDDLAYALAIHPTSGDVYVAGSTLSSNFPGTGDGAQATSGGGQDAFVARLNAALTTLDQASYLGGNGEDFAQALAIHPMTGDVYVAGYTFSTNFPATAGGAQAANGQSHDAFVARLTADLANAKAAALFRAYLSGSGNDANPCTLQQPCRLLPAALLAIKDGGEVWMLDSANYNTAPVNMTKSVTILAIPGVVGSIVASSGDAIDINTSGVKVVLRNLVFLNLSSGVDGVSFTQGAALTVEDCEIYGMGNAAISATAANGNVTVKNSVIRDNAAYGLSAAGGVTATFDGVHLLHNTLAGLFVGGNAQVTLSNSVVAENATFGVSARATGGTTTRVVVENSVLRANSGAGIDGFADSGGGQTQISVNRSSISHNGNGVSASTNAGGSVTMVLGGNVITSNTTGINVGGAGSSVLYSRQDNTLNANATDISGGTLMALPGK